MVTQLIRFYIFSYHDVSIKEYKYLKIVIHQIESKNEWFLLSASFIAKFSAGFCLNTGKPFFSEVSSQQKSLKPTERAKILLKSGTRDFQNSPPYERSASFYVTISGNFEQFQYFNFETDFLEKKNLFQKPGLLFFSWKHYKVENALFLYKTAIPEANVKTNRMVNAKWTYHKERNFASNYFIYWKKLYFSYKEFIWCINDPNAHISTFCKRWSSIWQCVFPMSIHNIIWSFCRNTVILLPVFMWSVSWGTEILRIPNDLRKLIIS